MDPAYDIVIVGGGIAGAGLGAQLAARRRVLIVEAEDQCGYHATGRSAAFYLESYGGPVVAPLTQASHAFLAEGGYLRRRGALHLGTGEWPRVPDSVLARRLDRAAIEAVVPGVRPQWDHGLFEPSCADIDVGSLHAHYLGKYRRAGGEIRTSSALLSATLGGDSWNLELRGGGPVRAGILVNAAGAWADDVAELAGVPRLGLAAKRRTMVQLRVGRSGLKDLPLVDDWRGSFYFKGEGDRSVWLSPHDEIDCEPCDAAPEELDVALAIDRFHNAVDWPVEQVERSWAGLRTFAPDRVPVYGFNAHQPAFFWCAGQGGFGIQTAPAASRMAAALLLGETLPEDLKEIDPASFSPARFG